MERILNLKSFLEELDDSKETNEKNETEFNNLLKPLPSDQIDAHTIDFLEETILHVAARKGIVWAAKILLEANASISEQDYKQCQPLHRACESGQVPLVKLLLDREADIQAEDWNGWSPLHYASSAGRTKVARLLLESGANAYATDSSGDTPFHVAAARGRIETIKLFLEDGMRCYIDVNATGGWRMTALHRAAFAGQDSIIKYLLSLDSKFNLKIDALDQDRWTPLMAATKGRHLSCMGSLLDKLLYAQANIPDNEDKTPLLVAIEEDFLEGVHILLKYMPEEEKLKANIYQRILSYNASTSTNEEQDMLRRIQESVLSALSENKETFDRALFKAAARFEWHDIAKKLLIYSLPLGITEPQSLLKSSAIELATQTQKPDLLWWLIATSPRTTEITKNIELALSTAKKKGNPARTQRLEDTFVHVSKPDEDNYGAADPTNGNQPSAWRHIIDILEYPQIAEEYEDNAALEPPVLKSGHILSVKAFEVLVANFYKTRHSSSTIRRTRNLRNIVYGRGPTNTMTKAISNLKNIMDKNLKDKNDSDRSSRLKAIYDKNNLRFSYVHLPATNIDWMKDLSLRIMIDEKQENNAAGYRELSSFLQSTWFEIPDRTSVSRFMRPQFMERVRIPSTGKNQSKDLPLEQSEGQKGTAINDAQYGEAQNIIIQQSNDHGVNSQEVSKQETPKGKEQEDIFIPSSALYMPFLSFATQEEERRNSSLGSRVPTKLEQQLNILKEDYKDSVVHSSATLDEAYYHFDLENAPTLEERNRRNRSQIVTKQLDSEPKDPRQPRKEPWPLLRVNQIWIWTIDDRWVISATSHPVDNVEQSWLDGFTEYLNKRIEAGGAESQPGSTKDMMKAMVNYCIGSYERRRAFQDAEKSQHTGLSIRQLFSNYINSIGRKETNLFAKFQELQNGVNTAERKRKFKEATIEAEQLFGELKDVRDELGIIKSIVGYQNVVQRKLFENSSPGSSLSTDYIADDIAEMEKRAGRIQSAVNSTLSLLQSEIANFQTEQSVKQGTNMMAFTSITAVFLPLSFLTSLFALDVESFEKAPVWAFKVIFGVSFPFAALVIYALYFHPYVMAKTKPIREYPKKQYEYIKKRYDEHKEQDDEHIKKRHSEYIKPYTWHIKKRYSRAKDEEEGPEETSLPEVLITGPSSNRVL